jgi:hypothetical protein
LSQQVGEVERQDTTFNWKIWPSFFTSFARSLGLGEEGLDSPSNYDWFFCSLPWFSFWITFGVSEFTNPSNKHDSRQHYKRKVDWMGTLMRCWFSWFIFLALWFIIDCFNLSW